MKRFKFYGGLRPDISVWLVLLIVAVIVAVAVWCAVPDDSPGFRPTPAASTPLERH